MDGDGLLKKATESFGVFRVDERAKKLLDQTGYQTTDDPVIRLIVTRMVDGQLRESRVLISPQQWRQQSHPGQVADSAIATALADVGWTP